MPLDLTNVQIRALPIDRLALVVLADMRARDTWSEHNYILETRNHTEVGKDRDALNAVAEAIAWLRGRAFIAHDPTREADVRVTRLGQAALDGGLTFVRASHAMQEGLHPLIETRSRPQFLLGEYEQAVFVAMRAVEVRVRQLAGYGDDEYGVPLMLNAFSDGGPLTDPDAVPGEQKATRFLFAGAYGVLRNPAGHREIDYDDVAEAAEAVMAASLLMRILDRVEARLA